MPKKIQEYGSEDFYFVSCGGHHLHCNKLAAARMFLGSLLWSLGLRQDCPGRCGNLDTTHAVRPEARPSNSGLASRFFPVGRGNLEVPS